MYSQIKKEKAELEGALRKACPKCHRLMKRVKTKGKEQWWCIKCGEMQKERKSDGI